MTNTLQTWKKVKIQDIADNLDNKRVPVTKSDRKSGQIPYYGATGIVDYVDDYIFDEKLLLIGEDGADWSAYANTAFIIEGRSWVNNHAHVLRVTDADIHFLMEYLNFSDLRLHVSGTTRGKLNKSDLMNIEVPLPSIQIQQRISNIIMTVNNEIEKTDQIIQKTENLKKGLLTELFVTGLGCSSFKMTVHGKIPSHWELKKVIEVASVVDSLHQTPKYSDSGYPMVRVMDIKSGDLNLTNCIKVSEEVYRQFTKNHTPIKGDLVISRVGSFGIFSYVNTSDNFCLGQNTAVISPKIDSLFLYYVLQSPIPTNQVNKLVVGSNQKTLSLGYIRNLFIPIPPANEQKEIAQILTSVDQKLANEKSYRDRLVVMKKGLMNDIFSRKVEVN